MSRKHGSAVSGLILTGLLSTFPGVADTDRAATLAPGVQPGSAQGSADAPARLPLGVAMTAAAHSAASRWNGRALDQCVKYRRNPLRVARALAVLHAGIQDAVASAARITQAPDLLAVAAAAAAGPVLDSLFPLETPGRFEALAWAEYAKAAASPGIDPVLANRVRELGAAAAERAIARAMRDGSDLVWDPRQRPSPGPGVWRATPPLHGFDPLEPLAAQWTTWVLRDGGELQPPPPVVYDSPAYWAETAEVLAVARALTPEQARLADDWNLGQGSVTPAGVWNLKARSLIEGKGLDLIQSARVLAVLNIAMADATVACWRAKFTYWTQRPVTAIRDRLAPDWLPHLLTPAFPSYVSNHASVSGAAATVLAAYFPDSAEPLRAAAAEAAQSRLWGGIHFRSDNDEGLKLGRRIARLILERLYGDRLALPLAPMPIPALLGAADG